MIELAAGDYRLVLDPGRGGSVARFDWRGEPLFRPTCGPSILDTACFPLVPFSNRIADGRFEADGSVVRISPNMPGSDHPHPLHGFGWLAPWDVIENDGASAVMVHRYPGGEWPWPYQATQRVSLSEAGLSMTIGVRNDGPTPMPAGVGFHPYLPRNAVTLYRGAHRGEWRNSPDGIPAALDERPEAIDWWQGAPVGARTVDTLYTDRSGGLRIAWPDRGMALEIQPSPGLPHTVVYAPAGADFVCIEPVSHMTDAVNRPGQDTGLRWLGPGENLCAGMELTGIAGQ